MDKGFKVKASFSDGDRGCKVKVSLSDGDRGCKVKASLSDGDRGCKVKASLSDGDRGCKSKASLSDGDRKGTGPKLWGAKEEELVIGVLVCNCLFNGIAALVRVHHREPLIVLLSFTLPCLCLVTCCIFSST